MSKRKSKKELFLELAKPDSEGKSRWVYVEEFVDDYVTLKLGNGGSWCRKSSSLAKEYKLEFDKTLTPGNSIDAIRTIGFNDDFHFNQNIRADIKEYYSKQPCVMLGVIGTSENTTIEVDHKKGTKDCELVSNMETQTFEDFQPLSKAANDAKRQICKRCMETDTRFDARIIKGYPLAYYEGNESLSESGCVGCYQYDPVEYRLRILEMARKNKI